jgi:DNA-nicking Smr family endonuclease
VTRRRRTLTAEERRLWAAVARATVPLEGRVLPPEEPLPSPPPQEAVASPAAPHAPRPTASAIKPLVQLERRTTRALARGQASADGILDLHGMTQAQAHGALIAFLRRAQAYGHSLVLVVTGKGAPSDARTDFVSQATERGILRRMVPQWLALPDLRAVVLGFEEAGPRQGGGGALYVRLRRPHVVTVPKR